MPYYQTIPNQYNEVCIFFSITEVCTVVLLFLAPGCDCARGSRFADVPFLCPQIGAVGEMPRFGDLSNSRAMPNFVRNSQNNTYWCPILI